MKILLLLALAGTLAAAELKIDHATVCGADVDAMRKALAATMNLPSEYGGPHSNHATEMALVSFPDGSYLELMGIQAKADPASVASHVWSQFLRSNAGPCAFALRVTDIDREVAHLKSAGISVGHPERSGRTRPDGTQLSWETVDEGTGPRGSLLPFLIRDFTPRENRAYPSGKPTTAMYGGIGKVVVGVRDLDRAIALYRKAFGLPAPRRQRDTKFGADLAWFENTPVVLAQALEADSWLNSRVREYGDAPCAYLLQTTNAAHGGNRPSTWFDHMVIGRTRLDSGGVWGLSCPPPVDPGIRLSVRQRP